MDAKHDDYSMAFFFEMDDDLTVIERSGYTILDWLSDVGGIQSMIWSLTGAILGIINGNYFNDSLIAKLYKYDSTADSERVK